MRRELTYYFDGEGRDFMRECINHSVEWCTQEGLNKIVIFTGTGDGPYYAAREFLSQDKYSQLQIIAVTPPVGRLYRTNPGDPNSPTINAGINPAMRDELLALGINIVAAHLPFKEIHTGRERTSEWSRVTEAYGILGGGFALCVQAVLVACDSGAVHSGERVVVTSADTAFAVIASRTESFLSPTEGLLVEHIICRPMRYRISKRTHQLVEQMWGLATIPQLPEQAVTTERDAKPEPIKQEASSDIAAIPNAPATTGDSPRTGSLTKGERPKTTKQAKKRISS